MSTLALALVLLAAPEQPTVVVAGVQAKDFEPHVVEILLSDLRAAIGQLLPTQAPILMLL